MGVYLNEYNILTSSQEDYVRRIIGIFFHFQDSSCSVVKMIARIDTTKS